MLFKRSVQRYGRTPPPETPYARAGQVWDQRIGSARAQAFGWKSAAFVSLGIVGGLAGTVAWMATQSRVVPYVVEVDALGEARAVQAADRDYRPTDPQIAWHLSHFVTNVRSISLDPVLMRRSWLEAYDFTTTRGAQYLSDHARNADPFGHVGERTVSVTVTSVVRASDKSFQVKWVETAFERGALVGTSRWTGILTIVTKTPASADVLRRNPLGIYIDAIDWSRELEPSQSPPTAPPQVPSNIPSGSPLDPTLAQNPPRIAQEIGA